MDDGDGAGSDMVSQPPHTHNEVSIARGDDGIRRHTDAGLIIFEEDNGRRDNTSDLGKQV